MKQYILWTLVGLFFTLSQVQAATVVMYHRFGDDRYPTTNITMNQFMNHINELSQDKYTVLPVPEIVTKLKTGETLPDHTVGITVDDGFASLYTNAWPLFKAAQLPFTIFISPDTLDQGPDYLTTPQLIEMLASGLVSVGNHGLQHKTFTLHNDLDGIIAEAQTKLKTHTGQTPTLVSYPFGKSTTSIQNKMQTAGFDAAFTQTSGAFDGTANFYALPRFALNEAYGDLDRFQMVINTKPLPVTLASPQNPVTQGPLGIITWQTTETLSGVTCYANGQSYTPETSTTDFHITLSPPIEQGQLKINCTKKAADGWYWSGLTYWVQ